MNHRPLLSSLALSLLCVTGCAGGADGDAIVHLRPLAPGRPEYVQHFGEAFARRNADGGSDVVLVDRSHPAVTQYLHAKVLWRPVNGMKADQPSATNAAIDWYVASRDPARPGLLRYSGAGFVLSEPAPGNRLSVEVRNASVKPEARRGDVYDPVGPTKVDGTFSAVLDAARVAALREEIDALSR